jgi:cell division protein FtsB
MRIILRIRQLLSTRRNRILLEAIVGIMLFPIFSYWILSIGAYSENKLSYDVFVGIFINLMSGILFFIMFNILILRETQYIEDENDKLKKEHNELRLQVEKLKSEIKVWKSIKSKKK